MNLLDESVNAGAAVVEIEHGIDEDVAAGHDCRLVSR